VDPDRKVRGVRDVAVHEGNVFFRVTALGFVAGEYMRFEGAVARGERRGRLPYGLRLMLRVRPDHPVGDVHLIFSISRFAEILLNSRTTSMRLARLWC
jgi:hypothetical protein